MRSMFGDWPHSALTRPAGRRLLWNASWCRRCWLWRRSWGRSWGHSTGERGPACPTSPALTLGGDKPQARAGSSSSSQPAARGDGVALLTSGLIFWFGQCAEDLPAVISGRAESEGFQGFPLGWYRYFQLSLDRGHVGADMKAHPQPQLNTKCFRMKLMCKAWKMYVNVPHISRPRNLRWFFNLKRSWIHH